MIKEKSLIRQMFSWGLEESKLFRRTSKEEKLLSKVIKHDDAIREKLKEKPELLEMYETANDAIEDLHCATEETYYVAGFKQGLLIGIEAAGGYEEG